MAKAKNVNLRKVLDEILLEGGISYNLNTGKANPNTGFMVSILGFEKEFDLDKVTAEDIKDYTINNIDELWGKDRFLGGWKDNDKVVLDISVNIEDMTRACYTGIINKQKCIYDCSNKRYINLPSPQTAGTEAQQRSYAQMKAEQLAYLLETTGVE